MIKLKDLIIESLIDDRGQDWLRRHNAKFDDQGRLIAYHGTTPNTAKTIKSTGFKEGSYFSLRKEYAKHWGRTVFEVHLPLDSVDYIVSDLFATRFINFKETI